jgi:hypothetical protein
MLASCIVSPYSCIYERISNGDSGGRKYLGFIDLPEHVMGAIS